MATLSFSCPKCHKLHERIKPEMIGHKVKCQCGFIFRIGTKASKNPGVVDDLNRRRAAKKLAARASTPETGPQRQIEPFPSTQLPPERIAVEIVDAVPVQPPRQPLDTLSNVELQRNDDLIDPTRTETQPKRRES